MARQRFLRARAIKWLLVGKRRIGYVVPAVPRARYGGTDARHVRAPWSLPSFAFATTICFILVPIIDPTASYAMTAQTVTTPAGVDAPLQTVTASGETALTATRNEFGVSRVQASAPAAGVPDPGTGQAIAYEMVLARGWGDSEFSCLVALWNRESHWNVYASNSRSGAYGIPQALPGEKMASVGADWATNPATQITWGLGYIAGRYGTPCAAWTSSETRGWY
jgi:hypothetical protein